MDQQWVMAQVIAGMQTNNNQGRTKDTHTRKGSAAEATQRRFRIG